MVAGPFTDLPEIVTRPPGLDEGVLPVAAIYGANASGKTNVLRALSFMSHAVGDSHRKWRPDGPFLRDPFLFDPASAQVPSEFIVDFSVGDERFQYGFSADAFSVLKEWLYAYPRGRRQSWFIRSPGEPISFSTKLQGENRTIEGLTRKNSLFLSAAAQNNHEALLPIYQYLYRSFRFVTDDRSQLAPVTARLCLKGGLKETVESLIRHADFGISGVEVFEADVPEQARKMIEAVASVLRSDSKADTTLEFEKKRLRFLHRINETVIPMDWGDESHGTVEFVSLMGPILEALDSGRVLCVDELDSNLHPLLSAQLIKLFNSPNSNKKRAQLIFNTQDTNLLSSGLLRRDQIWFTEKDRESESHLYPLSDFRPRKQENIENGYLQGRYGAIPFIDSTAFLRSLRGGDGEA